MRHASTISQAAKTLEPCHLETRQRICFYALEAATPSRSQRHLDLNTTRNIVIPSAARDLLFTLSKLHSNPIADRKYASLSSGHGFNRATLYPAHPKKSTRTTKSRSLGVSDCWRQPRLSVFASRNKSANKIRLERSRCGGGRIRVRLSRLLWLAG